MQELNTRHPDAEKLSAFGLGRLSEPEFKDVELHLADCDDCRKKVEEVPADALVHLLQASISDTQAGLASPSAITDSSSRTDDSVAPLYKKLAQIIAGKEENAGSTPPKAAGASAVKPGFMAPRELDGHARYLVTAPLGAGGMGTVYKAQHRLMDRTVALKIVNPLLVNRPGAAERFEREVKAAAKLVHPNIVTAFDAEKIGDLHILIMEFVEGQTLAEALGTQQEMPVTKACEYLRQTAIGLQHALERGMVHRDIKPQNLMRTNEGEIKILDFGLARFVSEEGPAGASTEHGALMGSPDYMAPEQGQDAHSADARADIYSMGCTLYHLLAGQVPFPEPSLLAKLEAHRDKPLVPIHYVRPDVPVPLAKVLEKMMAKDPAKRYQTPAEVAEALQPFTQTQPAPSTAPNPRAVAKHSSRAPLIPLVVAACLAIVGAGYWLAQTVLRVETPQGTLIIKSDDPDVQISVKGGGKEVLLFFPKEKKEIPLKVGPYEIELVGGKEGLKLSMNKFEINRAGDLKTVAVEFVPAVVAKKDEKTPSTSKEFEIPQPPPLAEWRKGRQFITVAQSGSADFRTIQEALNALKAGQYVRVLDKGPYRETIIQSKWPEDVGLISDIGTRIEPDRWFEWGPSPLDKSKKVYLGWRFHAMKGLRLHGFEITMPVVPKDTDYAHVVEFDGVGDTTFESCRVRYRDVTSKMPEDQKDPTGKLPALAFGCFKGKGRFLIQDNLIDGNVALGGDHPVQATVRRNWIRAWNAAVLALPNEPGSQVMVANNILQGGNGIYHRERGADKAALGRCLIANNVIDINNSPFWPIPLSFFEEKDLSKFSFLSPRVTIQNNIIRSGTGTGLEAHQNDQMAVLGIWKLGHNSFGAAPKLISTNLPPFPHQDGDLIVAGPFLSEDPTHADFLRIPADSRQAAGGVGGDLPSYIGAFPPGPAPKNGDWFTRLQSLANQEAPPRRLEDVVDPKRALMLVNDPFDDPAKSLFSRPDASFRFEKGRIVLRGGDASCWGDYRHHFGLDFACETTATTVAGSHKGWGLAIFGASQKKEIGSVEDGIEVLLSDLGEVTIAPSRWIMDKTAETPLLGPIRVKNFKPRDANALAVVVRDSQTVEVFVNGVQACDPFKLKKRLLGVYLQLASLGGDGDSELAFGSFKAWSLAPQISWPAVALREGRISAPDISKAKIIFQDGWATAKDFGPELSADKRVSAGLEKGHFYHHHDKPGGWSQWNMSGTHSSFVAQAEGRVVDALSNQWGLNFLIPPRSVSLLVMINGEGSLRVAWHDHNKGDRLPPLVEVKHVAIKRGTEFNKVMVILRDRLLEVYVNNVAVCDPMRLDFPNEPIDIYSQMISDKRGRVEFRRFSVWSAEGLPTPEERLKKGDVPLKAAPKGAFAWPVNELREGRIKAPDLGGAKVLHNLKLTGAKSGFPIHKEQSFEAGYSGGKYFIAVKPGTSRGQWPGIGPFADFAVEAFGRVTESNAGQWWLEVHNLKQERGLHFRLDGEGEMQIESVEIRAGGESRTLSRFRHSAIKPGQEFNRILLIVRGPRIEVYVNGIAVCDPIVTDLLMPAQIALGAWGQKNQAARGEFERVTLWSADNLPTPEERSNKGKGP